MRCLTVLTGAAEPATARASAIARTLNFMSDMRWTVGREGSIKREVNGSEGDKGN